MISPTVNIAANIPQSSRLLPEKAKPARPTTKQSVPTVINMRMLAGLMRRPTEYCSVTTIAAFTGRTTATTFSAKSPSAITITYWEIHDAKAPPTKEARKAEQVNHNRALSCNKTFGDQTLFVPAAIIFSLRLTQIWMKSTGKAEQMAASQKGKLIFCMTSNVPSGGPDSPANIQHGVVDRKDLRFTGG